MVVVNVLPHRGQNLLIHRKQIAHLFSRALGLLRNRLQLAGNNVYAIQRGSVTRLIDLFILFILLLLCCHMGIDFVQNGILIRTNTTVHMQNRDLLTLVLITQSLQNRVGTQLTRISVFQNLVENVNHLRFLSGRELGGRLPFLVILSVTHARGACGTRIRN